MTTTGRTWIAALVPLPALLVTALFCADTIGAMIGRRFFWPPTRMTLADALVLRNTGEVAFQLLSGVDPNEPSLLVQASRGREPTRMLPVEAAVLSGESYFLELLAGHGARLDDGILAHLRCQAERLGENQVRDWIDARLGRAVECDQ